MKKLTTILTAFALTTLAFAQGGPQEDFLNSMFEPCEEYEAQYLRTITEKENGLMEAKVTDLVGSVKMEGSYLMSGGDMLEHGKFVFYYSTGQVESSGYYEQGIKVGTWKRYTLMGEARADRYYNPESASFLRSIMDGEIPKDE